MHNRIRPVGLDIFRADVDQDLFALRGVRGQIGVVCQDSLDDLLPLRGR